MIRFDTRFASARHSFSIGSRSGERQPIKFGQVAAALFREISTCRFVMPDNYRYYLFEIAEDHAKFDAETKRFDMNVLAGILCVNSEIAGDVPLGQPCP